MASNDTKTKPVFLSMERYELEYATRQHWVYGFWLKNKLRRRLAKSLNLDWQKNAPKVTLLLSRRVMDTARVWCDVRPVTYRGQSAQIIVFVEDDNRNLDRNKFSNKQMDAIRRAMGLPKGTKPKWYEIDGSAYDPDAELDSDDEPFPSKRKKRATAKPSSYDFPDEVLDEYINRVLNPLPQSGSSSNAAAPV